MMLPPAVILHGAEDLVSLDGGEALTLLSPPGAGSFAGAGWWLALLRLVRMRLPHLAFYPFLDCGGDGAAGLEAIQRGVPGLILASAAPGWAECAALSRARGVFLLPAAPPARDPAFLRHAGKRRAGPSPPLPVRLMTDEGKIG